MNTDVLWPERDWAESQILRIQTKLHQWAVDDPDRRFDDLFNLVCDPAVLVVAWTRVRGNKGRRSAGVDGLRPDAVFSAEEGFLPRLREDLKARAFTPLPVRDRTVQAALKLVLEGVLEACFDTIDHPALMDRVRRRVGDNASCR